ncbi:hypothetical protein [Coleofasciculus sp. G2-EDA-02]|uniref:hypothetical protein n=1 Tax=Coleofasciculus sp. G2-EDA-02 TaxID=3069529 RepID=UPI0032F10F66
MKQGIIYIAVGQKYIDEAKLSAKSVKRFCPEINITLFTDTPQEARFNIFDNIVKIENSNSPKNQIRTDKLSAYLKTPYD